MHYFMLAGVWPKHMQLGPSTLSNCQQTMKVINENKKKGNKGYCPHYLKSIVTHKWSVSIEYSNSPWIVCSASSIGCIRTPSSIIDVHLCINTPVIIIL